MISFNACLLEVIGSKVKITTHFIKTLHWSERSFTIYKCTCTCRLSCALLLPRMQTAHLFPYFIYMIPEYKTSSSRLAELEKLSLTYLLLIMILFMSSLWILDDAFVILQGFFWAYFIADIRSYSQLKIESFFPNPQGKIPNWKSKNRKKVNKKL